MKINIGIMKAKMIINGINNIELIAMKFIIKTPFENLIFSYNYSL